ncbi:MAG: DUF3592 domain-containing protein [Zoogloeaceae bacterium]|nr:DUF3592 domain-containing protein [Zoogloeaceae bacterium]
MSFRRPDKKNDKKSRTLPANPDVDKVSDADADDAFFARSAWRASLIVPDGNSPLGRKLFGLGFVLIALFFCWTGFASTWLLVGAPFADWLRSRHWPQTLATLDAVQLAPPGFQTPEKLIVSYRYRDPTGQLRTGERYGLFEWRDDADLRRAAYAELSYQKTRWVHINPANPAETLIDRRWQWLPCLMALPSLLIGLAGVGMLWLGLRRR